MTGSLYLIPTFIDLDWTVGSLPETTKEAMKAVSLIVAENPKTTRRHLRKIFPDQDLNHWDILAWNKHGETDYEQVWACLAAGNHVGVMSEAGCPGIADPGSDLVGQAHNRGIAVFPLVGPSSLLLALMGSGFSGNGFCFHGYLPRNGADCIKKIRGFENGRTHIWMETPYRNQNHFEFLLKTLPKDAKLALAFNLLSEGGWVQTKKVSDWLQSKTQLGKQPCLFLTGL